MFEADLAYIQKYRAYPRPDLVGTANPTSVRLLNADPTAPLTVYMGTVLGRANPVLILSEHFVREVVPVDPPLYFGPFGPEGEPIERELTDSNSATDASDDDLPFDVRNATSVGYEYPFWPHIYVDDNQSHAYFVERPLMSTAGMDEDVPSIAITDCAGYTMHEDGFVATAGHSIDPTTSKVSAGSVPKRDAGTMPECAYRDMPAKDPVEPEAEMPDLCRRVLSDAEPLAAECVYLTGDEIKDPLQWEKLDVADNIKQRLFELCKEFRDIFASAGNSGKLDTTQHSIDTSNAPLSNRVRTGFLPKSEPSYETR